MAMETTAQTTEPLDESDQKQLLRMVHELVKDQIDPLVERPEKPAPLTQTLAAIDAFTELGILSGDDDRGLGLWDSPEDAASRSLSLDILREAARSSPSIAHLLHVRALAHACDAAATQALGVSTFSCDRTGPAGGRALGKSLTDTPLTDSETQAIAQAWGPPNDDNLLLSLDIESRDYIWYPTWTVADGWRLNRSQRESFDNQTAQKFHGFDELRPELHRAKNQAASEHSIDTHLGTEHAITIIGLYNLGLLVISAGASERALRQAQAYAHVRTQGGAPIEQHDAVAQLLEQARQAIASANTALPAVNSIADHEQRLVEIWRARAYLQPALSRAGSNSMQAFGGIGYMRDMGAEKVLRDLNTLRQLGGSPSELTLRCAGFTKPAKESQ